MLKLVNLSCGYPGKSGVKTVIQDISLEIKSGEMVGIIGPNGSGKTTLFRAITRIIPATGGRILYKERDIKAWPLRELAREISVLPQFMFLSFPFTVREFVGLGRSPYVGRFAPLGKQDEEIINQVMDFTGAAALSDRLINELSGGELQRVYLAQALAQEPKLLLLDEPTAHLDIGHQIEILHLLRHLNREKGLTIVIVLHDLNLASEYCDRLVMLNQGRVEIDGAPSQVLTFPVIEKVYRTIVLVKDNPISGKPYVILVPKDKWK